MSRPDRRRENAGVLGELSRGLSESASGWRLIAEIERDLNRAQRRGPPPGPLEELWEETKIDLKVLGHQLLVLLMVAVGYIILGVAFVFLFPYVWDWFWSFP